MESMEQKAMDDLGREAVDSFWWLLDRLKLDTQRGNSKYSGKKCRILY